MKTYKQLVTESSNDVGKIWKRTTEMSDAEYQTNVKPGLTPIEAYQKLPGIYPKDKSDIVAPPQDNEKLAAIWRNTANKTWDEYLDTVHNTHILKHQAIDSPSNDASKQRVSEYIEKHKHLIGSKNKI